MKELTNLKTLNNKKLLTVLPLNRVEEVLLSECAYSLSQQKFSTDVLVLVNGLDAKEIDIIKAILDKPVIKINKKDESGNMKQEIIESDKTINYIIEETTKSTFSEVFNEAFNYAIKNGYEWISLIEHDDALDNNLYSLGLQFAEELEEASGVLPILREISNGTFTGHFNEACWSEGMAEVAGFTDLQLLLKFSCLNLTGGIYKVSDIQEYSEQNSDGYYMPIKESIKLSGIYEFFLRMVYNDLKFFTMPRISYEHRVDRKDDTFNVFSSKIPKDLTAKTPEQGGMTSEEIRFWIDLTKKEYFFDEDRKIEYKIAKEEATV